MSNTPLTIVNTQARHLWLHLQDLLISPKQAGANHASVDTVRKLGMIQLDSINAVVRAHHHILWSRDSAYREPEYNQMLGTSPVVFEHFSHDAAILPLEIYPYWRRQHARRAKGFNSGTWGKQLAGRSVQKQILKQIEQTGPMCSRDFAHIHTRKADKTLHPWMRPPHKLALDYLWLKGDLCVSHRQGFIKHYDLTERVIPKDLREQKLSTAQQVDFLCRAALERLGFASAADIQRFYGACDLVEVKRWLNQQGEKVLNVQVESHTGAVMPMFALADIPDTLTNLPRPCKRLRILSPFDPLVRDRSRLEKLFGMQYRIEIFTPAAKRKYGYYVYPILEADKLTARIDVRANRKLNTLEVRAWWLEPGVRVSTARSQRLYSELKRLARLAGIEKVSDIPAPSRHP